MRESRPSRYRLAVRFRDDRVFVSIDGEAGPEALRHLDEVRSATRRCDFEVIVVAAGSPRPSRTPGPQA
jgi:hypothetical protein